MREILFRGKNYDGEWIEGFFVHQGRCYEIYHKDYEEFPSRFIEPKTVGQYTGLTDKNGKKIFEGDVIRVKYSLRLPAGFGNSIRIVTHGIDFIATVIFDKCRFCLEKANGEVCEMPLDSEAVEVIDNIHDNPELLEEKE